MTKLMYHQPLIAITGTSLYRSLPTFAHNVKEDACVHKASMDDFSDSLGHLSQHDILTEHDILTVHNYQNSRTQKQNVHA